MQEHWISATTARALVAAHSDGFAADRAISDRAHVGLVKSKARLFVHGSNQAENGPVPANFWHPQAFPSYVQHWSTGDLRSRIAAVDCQAFGVSFELDGILAALPIEAAVAAARSLSVSGNPAWLPAKTARLFAIERMGARLDMAGEVLIEQCRLGFAAARTVLMQGSATGERGNWTQETREWNVPTWLWEACIDTLESDFDWELGRLSVQLKGRPDFLMLSGVHFSLASLEAMLPPSGAKVEQARSPNGRPAAEFWDDLWCAIWGEVYRGDLRPKRQADVTRAMLDWAEANGHDLSDSSAKTRAKKMFEAMALEVKNPPAG